MAHPGIGLCRPLAHQGLGPNDPNRAIRMRRFVTAWRVLLRIRDRVRTPARQSEGAGDEVPTASFRATHCIVSSSKFYREFCECAEYVANITYIDDLNSCMCLSELILDVAPERPFIANSAARPTLVTIRPSTRSTDLQLRPSHHEAHWRGHVGSEEPGSCPDNSRSI